MDDINYIYENSVQENIIILIDSEKRDKSVWKEPNHFQIDFVEPFKNVYGVDILDINIPRTMYSIEDHLNKANFIVGTGSKWYQYQNYQKLEIDIRDYTLQELITELNEENSLLYNANISIQTDTSVVSENRKSIMEFTNLENPPQPFVFDFQNSTLGSPLGFDSVAQYTYSNIYTKLSSKQIYNTKLEDNNKLFASLPVNPVFYDNIFLNNSSNIIQDIPIQNSNIISEIRFTSNNLFYIDPTDIINETYDLIGDSQTDNTYGYFIRGLEFDTSLSSSFDQTINIINSSNVNINLPIVHPKLKFTIFRTNTTIDSVFYEKLNTLTIIDINSFTDISSSEITNNMQSFLNTPATILTNHTHYLSFSNDKYIYNIDQNNLNKNVFNLISIQSIENFRYFIRFEYDFTNYSSTYDNYYLSQLNSYKQKPFYNDLVISYNNNKLVNYNNSINKINLQIDTNILFDSDETNDSIVFINEDTQYIGLINATYNLLYIDSFKIISPGVVKLIGERYVTVHCEEIENHLRGSFFYNDYSPGLALVNLGILGFSQSRTEFTSVKYKEFHPIGKLNSLKFIVKRNNGELYNFKNVNWHMLLSIKFYKPKNYVKFEKSTLNPNYDYNYLKYTQKYLMEDIKRENYNTILDDENNDDDDDDDNEVNDYYLNNIDDDNDEDLRNAYLKEKNLQLEYLNFLKQDDEYLSDDSQ